MKISNDKQLFLARFSKKNNFNKTETAEKFYLIYRDNHSVGVFSNVYVFMNQISYAIANNMIPVIDVKHFKNSILPEDVIGKECAWETFFEQPCGYSVKDIKGKSVRISNGDVIQSENVPLISMHDDISKNQDQVVYWRKFYQKYIRLNEQTKDYIEQIYKKMFSANDRVIGVKVRGTDYLKFAPPGHAIPPQPEEVVMKTEELMEKYNCSKVFLATEDKDIATMFKEKFKDKIVAQDILRFDSDIDDWLPKHIVKAYDTKQVSLDYIADTYLLSKCNVYLGSFVSAGLFPILIKETDFDGIYFYDLKKYPKD